MKSTLPIVTEILKQGGSVELKLIDNVLYFDLNTAAKSELLISSEMNEEDGRIDYLIRGSSGYVHVDLFDVMSAVHDITHVVRYECMWGRDYVSDFWMKKFIEYGYAEKQTVTTIKLL